MRFGHSRNYLCKGHSDPVLGRTLLAFSMQLVGEFKLNT